MREFGLVSGCLSLGLCRVEPGLQLETCILLFTGGSLVSEVIGAVYHKARVVRHSLA